MTKTIEERAEEFMQLNPEQGKWRVERHVAKAFFIEALQAHEKQVFDRLEDVINRIELHYQKEKVMNMMMV